MAFTAFSNVYADTTGRNATAAPTPEGDIEYNRWLGREPKEIKALSETFRKSCQIKYLAKFEKTKHPFAAAEKWTEGHCSCADRFLLAKNDVMYYQIVNLDLRDGLRGLPPLPPELEIYLDAFEMLRQKCEKNPDYISPAERDANSEKAQHIISERKPKMKAHSTKKPKLPTRPQKSKEPNP